MITASFKEDQISQIPALQILHYANIRIIFVEKGIGLSR